MRRGQFIGGLLAVLLIASGPGMAQSINVPRGATAPPRVTPTAPKPPPVRVVIRPSQAAMIAQRAFSGAKVLGVKPKGKKFVVTLKVKDQVKQATVDGETGALQ